MNLNLTSLDGSGGVLHDIRSDLVSADPATRDIGASRFLKVYQMGIYASQMMVPGFGGTGMMTYYNKETPFNGLVDGQERVLMSRLLPIARVDFRYDGMINVPGLEMSGLLRTDSNASGSGSMSETVAIVEDDLNNAPYDMTVSYNGIGMTGTIPDAGGVYAMTVDTGGGPVDVTVLTDDLIPGNLDFAAVMP